ncbi:MAG TPA: sn-glycerol-3-phosphate ABC transporter ATP-binding protein UgpC [Nitriliruptorales bacterium]|nr:sn-glycerol-3-phosphate ABC transporter ATP-binding protein UgpC [Nitriliruptorales bacterium]
MAKVEFDGIWKRFPDGTEAIKDLNLEISDGEFVILVGPSGCGKSTALRMVAGLEEISDGSMIIGDRVVNGLTPKERDIAMVFQSYALYPHMSVFDNMAFALKLAKMPKDQIQERVKDAAATLGLSEYLHRKPRALSGGQRQRVAMGRAIVRKPQAFLMDEPLSNLDAKLRVQMRAEIAELQNRLGVTTIYVTHDQIEAMTMGDRVAVLKRGELMQVDTPQHLYDHPDNLFVAGFIGSPAMNLAEASLERDDGRLVVRLGATTALGVDDRAVDRYPGVVDHVGKKVAVGLRPEHFFRPDGSTPRDRVWPGRKVTLVEQLGAEMLVHFGTSAPPIITDDMREAIDDEDAFRALQEQAREGGQVFTARLEPGDPPDVDQLIDIGFRTEYLHFFDIESGRALR